jgi:hypothetical protein
MSHGDLKLLRASAPGSAPRRGRGQCLDAGAVEGVRYVAPPSASMWVQVQMLSPRRPAGLCAIARSGARITHVSRDELLHVSGCECRYINRVAIRNVRHQVKHDHLSVVRVGRAVVVRLPQMRRPRLPPPAPMPRRADSKLASHGQERVGVEVQRERADRLKNRPQRTLIPQIAPV